MSPKEDDRLNKRRVRDRDQADDLEEQCQQLAGARAEQHQLDAHTNLLAVCPPHHHPLLKNIIRGAMENGYDAWFLEDVQRLGLLRAALLHIDKADADAKERRRGEHYDYLPADRPQRYALLLEGLTDEKPYWRATAAKWISDHAPDRPTAVEVLTGLLHDDVPEARWHAALQLAMLAPQTPGLIDVLGEAVQGEWVESSAEHYHKGISGSGAAARALADMGACAAAALPALREALARPPSSCSLESADDPHLIHAYTALGGTVPEIVGSLVAAYRTHKPSNGVLQRLLTVGLETPGVLPVLVEVLQARPTNDEEAEEGARRAGWLIQHLARVKGNATMILPAFAATFDHGRRSKDSYSPGWTLDQAHNNLLTFLKGLCSAGTTTEDAFLATILKNPADETAWQVYADWLEERGEPRSAYLRMRRALRGLGENDSQYGNISKQSQDWLAAHDQGWKDVYDVIEAWQPDGEGASQAGGGA